MPIPVINPRDGDDLVVASIVANVTEKIRTTYESHEAGLVTNGALRHASDQIDDIALPESTAPASTSLIGTPGVHGRLDMFAVVMSAIMGTTGTGYAAKYSSLSGLTYPSINAINTQLTTNAVSAATGSTLVKRAADGSANFAATSAFVNTTNSGTLAVTGLITATGGVSGNLTGNVTGNVSGTASNITGVLSAGSFPAVAGDVTITAGSPSTSVVSSVGGRSASAINTSVGATLAASATAVGNHGVIAKYDASGGMTFDATVTAPSFSGPLTGNAATATTATNVAASGITGTIAGTQIDNTIARTANVPTNAGSGATGTWGIAISGNAATATSATTATNVAASGITGTIAGTQIDSTVARTANVPTNAGSGATGTWAIGISGNAATATSATSASSASSVPASGITGVMAVAQGGTGLASLPANGILVGNGTATPTFLAPGTPGNVPVSNGTSWVAGVVQVPNYSLSLLKLSDGAVIPDPSPLSPPNSMRVYVNAAKKFDGAGNPVQWSGGYVDLTSYVPGSGTSVWVMIYLNATAAVYAAAGAASATPLKPQAIGGQTPLAYVLLYAGQINVASSDIYDWRTDFAAFAVGGGTGSGYSGVGHLHGQGGESFVALGAMDEGRVTTPNVAGMTVYVQPTRYSDTNSVVQQFPGGASATIARPINYPYYVAVGLSQAGAITLNYGAEGTSSTNMVKGTFLNTTDIPLAYVLVRPGSTRTVLNDDNTNAVINDARRPYGFSSAAAAGITSVSGGGTGSASFPTTGLVYTPGGTSAFTSIPVTMTATVGLGFNPTVTPAGANADLFQGGGGIVDTGATNISGTVNGLHILATAKKVGATGTIGTFNALTIDAQTIGTTNNSLNVIGNAVVSGNMTVGGGLTFNSNLVITAATAVVAQFNSNAPTGIVAVMNHAASATGLIQSWQVNGVERASIGPAGTLTIGPVANSNYGIYALGGGGRFASLTNPAAPTIGTIVGGAAASYWYWIVAQGRAGNYTLISPSATTAVGPTAFAATTNTVALSWTAVTGAATYYVLRTTSSTAPTGAATVVSGSTTGTTYTDAIPAASLTALPGGIPTRNATGDLTVDGLTRSVTALRVGNANSYTAADGADGTIIADGTGGQVLVADRNGNGTFSVFYRSAGVTSLYDNVNGSFLSYTTATNATTITGGLKTSSYLDIGGTTTTDSVLHANLGAVTGAPSGGVLIDGTMVGNASYVRALAFWPTIGASTSNNYAMVGLDVSPTMTKPTAGITNNAHGLYVGIIGSTGAGTGTISNAYGLYVNAPTAGANNYAAYLGGLTRSGTAVRVGSANSYTGSDAQDGSFIADGTSGQFLFTDRNGNGTLSVWYRSAGVTNLYDSANGNVWSYTTATKLTTFTGPSGTPAGAIAQEAWTVATLGNSWTSYGGNYFAPSYFKDTQGVVHLRGGMAGGTLGATAFTLPVGYRPTAQVVCLTVQAGAAAGGYVTIASTGTVTISGTSNTLQGIDGITFDTR